LDLGAIDGRALPVEETDRHDSDSERRAVFSELDVVPSETYGAVNYRALWVGSTKCIENLTGVDRFGGVEPRYQVFDVGTDPGEQEPLPEDDPRFALCVEMLTGWAQVIGDRADGTRDAPLASEETVEMLRSLGYIK
jgi:hypothetical protein